MLLVTHILLPFAAGHNRLKPVLRMALEDQGNEILVSTVSLWNAAIKVRIGKLAMDIPALIAGCVRAGLRIIELSRRYLGRLPPPGNHPDPFDDLLLA